MTRLSRSDLEGVLGFAGEVAVCAREAHREDEQVLSALARLIDNEMLKYCRVDTSRREHDVTFIGPPPPPDADDVAALLALEGNPYTIHGARIEQPHFQATRFFDIMALEEFRRTKRYRLMWLAEAASVQMRMPGHDGSYWSLEAIHPEREFTDRQLALLDAARPWLELYEDRRVLAAQLVAIRAAPAAQVGAARLSDREQQVLDRVADGASNQEIADALHISPLTVRTHLEHIYAKLEVPSRTAALARTGRTTAAPH